MSQELEPLTSLDQLMALVRDRRAVKVGWQRLPAAVVANWQCSRVAGMVERQQILIWPKSTKPQKPPKTKEKV
jgi:hypothetical protein